MLCTYTYICVKKLNKRENYCKIQTNSWILPGGPKSRPAERSNSNAG